MTTLSKILLCETKKCQLTIFSLIQNFGFLQTDPNFWMAVCIHSAFYWLIDLSQLQQKINSSLYKLCIFNLSYVIHSLKKRVAKEMNLCMESMFLSVFSVIPAYVGIVYGKSYIDIAECSTNALLS